MLAHCSTAIAAPSCRKLLGFLRLALLAVVAAAAVPAARAMTFEEAVTNLSSEDFALRDAGESFLRTLAPDDAPRIDALIQSADPEVAFRARRALFCLRLRLNDSFPADLARNLIDLPEMGRRETRATLAELLSLQPLPLITLAGLHSELLTHAHRYAPLNGDSLKSLAETITLAAASKSQTLHISQIRAADYHDQTLALLVDGFAGQGLEPAPVLAAYSSWVALRPSIIPLLARSTLNLEFARIEAANAAPNKQIGALLSLAASFPTPGPQRKAILTRMTELLRANPQFPVESLDRDQGYTFFASLEGNWDPLMDVSAYLKFRERFPQPHPNPQTSTLEAIYLLYKEGTNAALALALSQPNDHAAVWLGSHLNANPDKIPSPLVLPPVKKDDNRHPHLSGFLDALVGLRDLNEMESNPKAMAAVETLLRDPEWIDIALKANVGRLVFLQWIRAGTLDEAIPKRLSGNSDHLRALGRLLVTKPESMAMINPANQSPLDLKRILLGMLEQPLPRPVAEVLYTHADEWLKLHPDMWKTESARFDIPRIESMAADRTEALHKLLSLALKTKGNPDYPRLRNPALDVLLRSINRYAEEAHDFPTAKLTAEEGILFFEIFGNISEGQYHFGERYLAFRKRFPEPLAEPESMSLEALVLLEDRQLNKAFSLSLLQESTAAAEWVGEWLNEHPEALEKPLPLPANSPRLHFETLLDNLAPYKTLAECHAHPKQMAALKVLIDTPEWLNAALRGQSRHLVCLHILLTGQLDSMLATRLAGQPEAVVTLGTMLAEHPELLASIKPENQSATSLQPLVLGLNQAQATPEQRAKITKTTAEWAKIIPRVLDPPTPAKKPRTNEFQMHLEIE